MSKQKNRYQRSAPQVVTPFEEARDEMFQHIMKCGVIGASPEDQKEWFDNTMTYLADRYHELNPRQNMAFWERDLSCVREAKTPD